METPSSKRSGTRRDAACSWLSLLVTSYHASAATNSGFPVRHGQRTTQMRRFRYSDAMDKSLGPCTKGSLSVGEKSVLTNSRDWKCKHCTFKQRCTAHLVTSCTMSICSGGARHGHAWALTHEKKIWPMRLAHPIIEVLKKMALLVPVQ